MFVIAVISHENVSCFRIKYANYYHRDGGGTRPYNKWARKVIVDENTVVEHSMS